MPASSSAWPATAPAVAFTYASSKGRADALVAELTAGEGRVIAIEADSGDVDAVKRAVQRARDVFGRLDILVNNAAIARTGQLVEASGDDIERMLAVNVRGPVVATQEALRHMDRGGRIINIGSINSEYVPFPGASLYALTKGALSGFTHGLARELGARRLEVDKLNAGGLDGVGDRLLGRCRRGLRACGEDGHGDWQQEGCELRMTVAPSKQLTVSCQAARHFGPWRSRLSHGQPSNAPSSSHTSSRSQNAAHSITPAPGSTPEVVCGASDAAVVGTVVPDDVPGPVVPDDDVACPVAPGKLIVSFFQPLWSRDRQRVAGVAGADITLDQMAEIVEKVKIADNGFGFLAMSDGNVVAINPIGEKVMGLRAANEAGSQGVTGLDRSLPRSTQSAIANLPLERDGLLQHVLLDEDGEEVPYLVLLNSCSRRTSGRPARFVARRCSSASSFPSGRSMRRSCRPGRNLGSDEKDPDLPGPGAARVAVFRHRRGVRHLQAHHERHQRARRRRQAHSGQGLFRPGGNPDTRRGRRSRRAFNRMAEQISFHTANLEQLVEDRTREIEMANRELARREASEKQQALDELDRKREVIEQQRTEIRELSTPVLQVWDDVLAVPITAMCPTNMTYARSHPPRPSSWPANVGGRRRPDRFDHRDDALHAHKRDGHHERQHHYRPPGDAVAVGADGST